MNKGTQNIELKESWRDEYLKWICGFANAQGGTLYIGVTDNGEVCGLQDAKKLMDTLNRNSFMMAVAYGLSSISEKNMLTLPRKLPRNYPENKKKY